MVQQILKNPFREKCVQSFFFLIYIFANEVEAITSCSFGTKKNFELIFIIFQPKIYLWKFLDENSAVKGSDRTFTMYLLLSTVNGFAETKIAKMELSHLVVNILFNILNLSLYGVTSM